MTKKLIIKAMLFPPIGVMIALLPIVTVLLVYAMVFVGQNTPIAYVSYALSAYTLTIWCLKIPYLIRFFRTLKNENKYVKQWLTDARLRVNVSLFGGLAWNLLYGIFQLGLGFYHRTFWFGSLGAYYICMAVMRFALVLHTRKYSPGEHMHVEVVKYRTTGWIFLVLNLMLSVMIFFMVYWNRTFVHHEIVTIAMAAYTFTALTVAIVNVVRYRRYQSPVFSASKAISLASALVSMLTLTSAMLTSFGDASMDLSTRRLFLGLCGGGVSAVVIAMALYMIVQGNKKFKTEVTHGR